MRLTRYRLPQNLILRNAIRFNSNLSKLFNDGSDAVVGSISKSKTVNDIKDLIIAMERRKYNTRRIGFVCLVIGGFIFYGKITDWATDQAADVTSKYLENPKFKKDIMVFVEQTVNELVKSPKIQEDITTLLGDTVKKLADNPQIQDKLADLFVTVFKSESVRNSGAELSEEVVSKLLHDPKYESIRNDAINFVIEKAIKVVNNDELQQNVGLASWNAFKVWFGSSTVEPKQQQLVTEKT